MFLLKAFWRNERTKIITTSGRSFPCWKTLYRGPDRTEDWREAHGVLWSYRLPSQHPTSMGRCRCEELGKVKISIHMQSFLSQAKLALSHLSPWATRENPGQKLQRGVRFQKHTRRKAEGFDGFCPEEERFNNCLQTDEGLYPGPVRAWRPCVLGLHRMVMRAARLQQEKLLTSMHSGHKPVVLGCSRVCWARNCFI